MTIGPLPAGTNQKFVLPGVIDIPASTVDSIVKQTNENSLEIAKANTPKEGEIRNSANGEEMENTENTVDVNESNASTSNAPNNNNNNPTNDPNNNNGGIRNIFNHSRRSSNVSRRSSKHSTKKETKERRIIWYPLIIVLEALEKKGNNYLKKKIKNYAYL